MKPQAIGVLLLLISTLLYANPENKGCDSYHCSKYEWDHGLKKFDPHSIKWPLHYTGELYKDVIDGGHQHIYVVYKDHYHKKQIASLKDFRKMPYCPDPHYLKDGIPMEYYFECHEEYAQKPHWKDTDCSLIGKTHEDKTFYIDGPACSKIVREWVLIDWCKYEPNTGADYNEDSYILVYDLTEHKAYFAFDHYGVKHDGYYKFKQVIKIVDSTKPTLENCDEITYDLKGKCAEYVKIKNTIWDDGPCMGQKMEVNLEIYDSHGSLVHKDWFKANHGEEFWVNAGHLYPGWYTLKWHYKDGCNNKNYCSQKLKVIDSAGPSLLCIHKLSSSISDEYGMTIWAKDFVLKATDPCGYDNDIEISFSPDIYLPSLTFDCSGDFGFHELKIYATSKGGAQTSCNVELLIADHFACSDNMQIAGLLYNVNDEPLVAVDVDVMQGDQLVASSLSNHAGQYLVDDIPMTKSVEIIEPHIYENPKDGLDAQDLIVLLRHITGQSKFTNVLEYAAADVNSDSRIDMNDFWTLASLIYDLSHRAVDIKPWKFIDTKLYRAGFTRASDLTVPIVIRHQRHRYDMIGLKTGDVDFSWSATPKSKKRSNSRFLTRTDNGSVNVSALESGALYMVELLIRNASPTIGVIPNSAFWGESEVIRDRDGDDLRVILTSPTALSIATGQSIFEVSGANENIENAIEMVVYLDDNEGIVSKNVSFDNSSEVQSDDLSDGLKVSPNPFIQRFNIKAELSSENPVILKLYNVRGQLVNEMTFPTAIALKSHVFEWGQDLNPGLYILELRGDFGSMMQKMIKQK